MVPMRPLMLGSVTNHELIAPRIALFVGHNSVMRMLVSPNA